jgi:hypothetical protein
LPPKSPPFLKNDQIGSKALSSALQPPLTYRDDRKKSSKNHRRSDSASEEKKDKKDRDRHRSRKD